MFEEILAPRVAIIIPPILCCCACKCYTKDPTKDDTAEDYDREGSQGPT